MNLKLPFLIWATIFIIAGTISCGRPPEVANRKRSAPIVVSENVTDLPAPNTPTTRADLANATSAYQKISAEVTLKKSEIFGRTFLYGFDLQYSSVGDPEYSLLDQSMALGHVPAEFRRLGETLQLVADSRHLFESAVNHPETLINTYAIVRETSDELTITMDKPGLLVHKTINGPDSDAPAQQWVRSIEFVEEGTYILQESAIMLANGDVQTFLESLFPREAIVPQEYEGIEDRRDTNPFSARFMLINNDNVFVQRGTDNGVPLREETSFANRFHLKDETSTIDWYVTANAPEELMGEIRSGVIGWNRYFNPLLGRDVVRFMGRLPRAVKLGDPRYNVINFDTVAQAGAAYESQAADPTTGIQSHSMIYMPYAWYNIAADLSAGREIPGSRSLVKRGPKASEILFGKPRRVLQCMREAEEVAPSGAAETVDDFGRRVFISTLFHEMGHALGLGHNFKGSLSFDGSKPRTADTNPTTHSVMDYNYYQHELDLFDRIGDAEGRMLEYDRQIISYLYKSEVGAGDKVIPACNDDDADSKSGGVDPNCLRYDAESNPVLGLAHAYGRLTKATGAEGLEAKTLAEAIRDHEGRLMAILNDPNLTPDANAARDAVTKKVAGLSKLVGYYITSGAQSLRVNLVLNSNALRVWRSDPAGDGSAMTEAERRSQYANILKAAITASTLPPAAQDAVKSLISKVADVVSQSERFGTTTERQELSVALAKAAALTLDKATASSFARVRGSAADKLAYDPELSFASGTINGLTAEQIASESLVHMLTVELSKDSLGTSDAAAARMKAAASLKTFLALGDDYKLEIEGAKNQLEAIRRSARTANQEVVDHIRALLKVLNG